ncbi:N-formylglutamate deformylase [Nostoc sp. 3335mG]|nr:N-formylglutamate deformylase [Nostoc sp. 3335mG]
MAASEIQQGSSPVILGFPHTGTDVPTDIRERLNDTGRMLADTDWHVHQLYDGLLDGATTVRATFHRYVIDANRDPGGSSLYPGQNTTALIPETDFDAQPIWKDAQAPTQADIEERLRAYHAPYHAALAAEIERVKAIHGVAILFDCHSIRSRVPFLFEGKLPDFNIGTDMGRTCAPAIQTAVEEVVAQAGGFDHVVNGRFKGGWTTRHYGQPRNGVHAIQMEMTQSSYLATEEPPFALDAAKADRVRVHLKTILERLAGLAPRLT